MENKDPSVGKAKIPLSKREKMLADKLAALGLNPDEGMDSEESEDDDIPDKQDSSLPKDDSKATTGKPSDGQQKHDN